MTSSQQRIIWPFIAAIAMAAVTIGAVAAIVFHAIHTEDQRQLRRMQDSLCGFFVPISGAPVTTKTQELGRTLVIASKHGAQVIDCPKASAPH